MEVINRSGCTNNNDYTDVSKNVLKGGCTAKHKDMASDIEIYNHRDTKKKQNTH